MAPLEWDTIMAARPSALTEEAADNMYDILKEVGHYYVCGSVH